MFRGPLIALSVIALAACSAETASNSAAPTANAQSKPSSAPMEKIVSEDLGNGLHLLVGPGGNIVVSVGADGALVIDDKFERFGGQIVDIIGELSGGKIRYVLNTHHHGDHTGANGVMTKAGAVIVAHDNVRKRLVSDKPANMWPVLTYSESATFHFNDQTTRVIHMPTAHTDGDSIIYFEEANLLHMGDNFFNGMFPYVDVDSGGTLQGMIAAQESAASMIDGSTIVIPGHGPVTNKAGLEKSISILRDIRDRVQARIDAGDDVDAILKAKVLTDYKDLSGFIDESKMVRTAHRSLTGK